MPVRWFALKRRIMAGITCALAMALLGNTFLRNTAEARKPAAAQEIIRVSREAPMAETLASSDSGVCVLYGVDGEGETGRSDCVMLLRLKGRTLRLCSLARDTLVEIPGVGREKLCHAYAYGGPELARRTLRDNFGVEPVHYVSVNFAQMPRIIDMMGGVDLPLSDPEWHAMGYGGKNPGWRHMSGREALTYCRIRYLDSDDGRTARQRTLIEALIRKLEETPRQKLPSLALSVLAAVRTDMKAGEVLRLGKQALLGKTPLEVETLALPGDALDAWGGLREDGLWYYVYDLEAAARVLRGFL